MSDVWKVEWTLFNSKAAQTDCKSLTESTLRWSSPMWVGENKQGERKEGKMSICLSTRTAAMSLKQNTSINRQPTLLIQDIMVLLKPSGIHNLGCGSDRLKHAVGWTRQWRYCLIRPCINCLCCFYINAWMHKHTHTHLLSGRLKKPLMQKEHRATAFWPAQE